MVATEEVSLMTDDNLREVTAQRPGLSTNSLFSPNDANLNHSWLRRGKNSNSDSFCDVMVKDILCLKWMQCLICFSGASYQSILVAVLD